MNGGDRAGDSVLAARSPRLWQFFTRVFARQLRRNFYAIHLLEAPRNEPHQEEARILFTNHPSWNDPMVISFLHCHFFPHLDAYAPIDETALEAYGFMKRIGLFGVNRENPRSVRQFLRISRRILEEKGTALWVTPQGRFADARERPVRFEAGLGVLLKTLGRPVSLHPVALEYAFCEEKRPEIFVSFGDLVARPQENSSSAWTRACELALEKTQNDLAERVVARSWDDFTTILGGKAGVGGFYQTWQRCKALLAGKKFDPSHGSITRK